MQGAQEQDRLHGSVPSLKEVALAARPVESKPAQGMQLLQSINSLSKAVSGQPLMACTG